MRSTAEIMEDLISKIHKKNKKDLTIKIGEKFGRKPHTVRVNWLRDYYAVPDDIADEVIDFIENYEKNQPNH